MSAACAPDAEPELPDPPEGAELLLELGDLEVYKVFDGDVCAGTWRRIELQVEGLSDLLAMDPPPGRVYLHRDSESVDDACGRSKVAGCALGWEAHATASSVRHELVHLFVYARTDYAQPRAAIDEGIATRLDGTSHGSSLDGSSSLEDMLAVDSALDVARDDAAHFFAWAIDEFGIEPVLDGYIAASKVETDDDVGGVLADSLGFPSLADLEAEYETTAALVYPALPDTVKVYAAEELVEGVDFDSSCSAQYAEGPSAWPIWVPNGPPDPEVMTIARLEIPEPGEYEVEAPFDIVVYPGEPSLSPTQPWFDPITLGDIHPERCTDDRPWRFAFHLAGQYRVVVLHPIGQSVQGTLRVAPLGTDQCTY